MSPTDSDHRLGIARFSGEISTVKIDRWIKLFEVVSADQATDQLKVRLLMKYLDGDALNWYADDVVPSIATTTWDQVKEKIIRRFGQAVVCPVVTASRRRLLKNEKVQAYYEDKMRILRQTSLSAEEQVGLLTDGMPNWYRPHLIAGNPTSPQTWLTFAIAYEATYIMKPQQQFNPLGSMQNPITVNTAQGQFPKKEKRKPPGPCAICLKDHGIADQWHWHSDCPHNKNRRPQNNSSNAPRTISIPLNAPTQATPAQAMMGMVLSTKNSVNTASRDPPRSIHPYPYQPKWHQVPGLHGHWSYIESHL